MLSLSTVASTAGNDPGFVSLSEDLAARLMRNSPVGIVISSIPDGRILEANDAYLRLMQYDRSEVVGHTGQELGLLTDPGLRETVLAALDGSAPLRDFEMELRTRTGEARQVLVSVEMIELDGRSCLLSHIYDMTERRQLEERLRIRDHRYRAIFNNTFQFTGLLTPDGILLEANQTALDFAGLTADDILGRPFWQARWWTGSAETRQQLRAAITRASQGEFIRYDVDVRGQGDTVATIDFSLKPLRDDAGQIVYLIPEGRDITELRKVEAALLESEERFRSAFEWSPIGIALVGLDGHWLEVNRALCEIVGYTEEELRARTFQDITHPDDLEADLAQAQRLFAGEIPSYQMEKRYIRKDGQTIWVLLTGSLIHAADGSAHSALAQVLDITANKRAAQETERALELQQEANAELQRLSQAQRNFLSIFTHDFRTPLTSILGYSEVLQSDGFLTDEAAQFAGIIADNARRLNRMVDDLLDLDRLEAGQEQIRRQPVDVGSVLREVAALFHPSDDTHHIVLKIEPDLPYITGDRDKLIRAVSNLVDNAIKYSPGGGQITITARRADDVIAIDVRDRGIGIPAGDLEAIFDRYARVESDATRRIRGTGLGLSIVREIIDAHDGRVWAESGSGKGSTFHITLPIPVIEEARTGSPGSAAGLPR